MSAKSHYKNLFNDISVFQEGTHPSNANGWNDNEYILGEGTSSTFRVRTGMHTTDDIMDRVVILILHVHLIFQITVTPRPGSLICNKHDVFALAFVLHDRG